MFIPCYCCSEQIKRVLSKINIFPPELEQILLVDNASTDQTVTTAVQTIRNFPNAVQKKFRIVKNKENYGLGGSFKLAMDYALKNDFTHFLVFHGDDQADYQNALQMIEVAKENPTLDALLGSRFMSGAELHNYSWSRFWGNKVFNWLFSFILKKRIEDIGSGVNLYKIKALPIEHLGYFPDHLAFDILILFHFSSDKYQTCFLPTNWTEKDQVSNARNARIALTILKMLWDFKRGKTLLNSSLNTDRAFIEVVL